MKRPWLAPFNPVYGTLAAINAQLYAHGLRGCSHLQAPVVSIGSLSAGGAGKTPFLIALIRLLQSQGIHVDVLSRGYGRSSRAVARVEALGLASEFGDEPLLIARETGVPVFVGASRQQAGAVAELTETAALHLLDDGFQHRQLCRQADLVLVTAEDLRDHLLPGGNLREPLPALHRAQALAVRAHEPEVADILRKRGFNQPLLSLSRTMRLPVTLPAGERVVSFCGIARPEEFFTGLTGLGLEPLASQAFPDHHPVTQAEIDGLKSTALAARAQAFVTTAKDLTRLTPPQLRSLETVAPVLAVHLETQILDQQAVLVLLRQLTGLSPRA